MALVDILILRKPRSGCLEGRTALIQPMPIPLHPLSLFGSDRRTAAKLPPNVAVERREKGMFDLDRFIADCRAAVAADPSFNAAREVVARAIADPAALIARLGEPKEAGVEQLYHSAELNILNFAWGPQMTLLPHNHLMRVVIGIYTGREDNIFWRRVPGAAGGRIEPCGVRCLSAGDAVVLEEDAIHSVTNPLMRPTGAIHVYGGDFFGIKRSEWDPETLLERPFDLADEMRWFAEMNALHAARQLPAGECR